MQSFITPCIQLIDQAAAFRTSLYPADGDIYPFRSNRDREKKLSKELKKCYWRGVSVRGAAGCGRKQLLVRVPLTEPGSSKTQAQTILLPPPSFHLMSHTEEPAFPQPTQCTMLKKKSCLMKPGVQTRAEQFQEKISLRVQLDSLDFLQIKLQLRFHYVQ